MKMAFDDETPALTVGEIVAADIRTAEVFKRLGIDFCCNGKRTLVEACGRANLPIETVVEALHKLPAEARRSSEKFDEWELGFLADYVLTVHHGYLYDNLPLIEELVLKVAAKHGDRYPKLHLVQQAYVALKADLLSHLQKEEIALFPIIKELAAAKGNPAIAGAGRPLSIKAPIDCMEHEHQDAGLLLFQLRELTDEYSPPADACNSHRLMLAKLAELEADLMQHIHLENNILFPKALAFGN
ncbi:iron-sulfur cluster repair di-iron protein [Larkinella punicea]|uniref:Iron-sulfur cluster repair di-iron protein n=1 Tax=Larkinella punicea TaxID=2315727 RepID=A0A368JT33_9BACT|nr:iron-sulfur cluster repair di-iron protein [Larkinella punicea]RCR70830.1 iron-sulfur cluster repair di-iron protein [Larkinella punicea]